MADAPKGWVTRLKTCAVALAPAPAVLVSALIWAWRDTDPAWAPAACCLALTGLWILWVRNVRSLMATWRTLPTAARWAVPVLLLAGLAITAHDLRRGTAPPAQGRRVAVVGGGAGGMHAAWLLARTGADVTLYEASPVLGGHAYAFPFQAADGTRYPIDLGFMFGAPGSYKEMKALLALEGVERNYTTLGLAGHVDDTWWATGMADLPPEVLRFQELADASYDNPALNLVPFDLWLTWHGFDEAFRRTYIMPLMSVLFITDHGVYKVSTRFMLNMIAGPRQWVDFRHDAPAWTVKGSSAAYYQQLTKDLHAQVRLLNPVTAVERQPDGHVRVLGRSTAGVTDETFDAVVLAVHADVAAKLLKDASWVERFALEQVRYHASEVVVHTDHSAFPDGPLARNYTYTEDTRAGTGFELSSLPVRSQGDNITLDPEPVVTLGPQRTYANELTRRTWKHHVMDLWHLVIATQILPHLQGNGNVWYAGDWVQFIGHGQAVQTGLRAACAIGGTTAAHPLAASPCFEVSLQDATPHTPAYVQNLCGEQAVFDYVVAEACIRKGMP